ncbi:MAG: mechanosensitive ion channel family protein [Candidatus Sumerlaeia bacterium]
MTFQWQQLLTWDNLATLLRVALLVFVGLPLFYGVSRWLRRYLTRRYTSQHGLIGSKIVAWGGTALVTVLVLSELKFPISPLLGAAGVVGIAVGFASQTSVSNIISGLFLIAEKPFQVDDVIQVGNTTGVVLSIDTLSIKIRTFDNRYVRIPNESLIKTEVVNITRFPLRRVDITVGVAYKENLGRVREILLDISHKHPLCLEEPAPMVIITGYNSSSIDLLFVNWVEKKNFIEVRNDLYEQILERFRQEGIEIPFPHLSLYTGSQTDPFPVSLATVPEERPSDPSTGQPRVPADS